MREALFILFVVFLLFGLTAIRYRKQIAGMIGLARMLKDVKGSVGQSRSIRGNEQASLQLVNCTTCGVWVPQNKAIKLRDGNFYCSNDCVEQAAKPVHQP